MVRTRPVADPAVTTSVVAAVVVSTEKTVGGKLPLLAPDQAAWDDILRFAKSRKALRLSAWPYRWNRLDAYEDREKRFNHYPYFLLLTNASTALMKSGEPGEEHIVWLRLSSSMAASKYVASMF